MSIDEAPGTGVLLVAGDVVDGRPVPLPLREIQVRANLIGTIADVEVRQVFTNTLDRTVECRYVFPLPPDAAVYDLEMRIGDRVIKGVVEERAQARRTYEAARARGDGAALLEQERPDLFTTQVANVLSGSEVEVRIRFAGHVSIATGRATFTVPLTLTPRYVPQGHAPVGPAHVAGPGSPAPRVSIEAVVSTGIPLGTVRCVLHDASVENINSSTFRLKIDDARPDRDFILQYDFGGREISSALFTHADAPPSPENPGTFLLFLVPPLETKPEAVFPREVIFLLDRSGSMGGSRIEAARAALRLCLRGLRPGDRFQVIAFDDRMEVLARSPLDANESSLALADRALAGIDARDGTELNPALRIALGIKRDPLRHRAIVVLTDGGVGNEDEIFRTVEEGLGDGRLYVLSIGMAPNHHLVDKLATLGRGFAHYVPGPADIEREVATLLAELERPILVRPTLEWPESVRDVSPEPMPDLSADRPVAILGRYTQAGTHRLTVTGRRGDSRLERRQVFSLDLTLPDHDERAPVLPQMWARAQVEKLLDRERSYGGNAPELRAQVVALACRFRLASPYTSFVAVEERSEEDRHRANDAVTIDVPALLPADASLEEDEGDANVTRAGAYRGFSSGPVMAKAEPAPPAHLAAGAPMTPASMVPPGGVTPTFMNAMPPAQPARSGVEKSPIARGRLVLIAIAVALVGLIPLGHWLGWWRWYQPVGYVVLAAVSLVAFGVVATFTIFFRREGSRGVRSAFRELVSDAGKPTLVVTVPLALVTFVVGPALGLWPWTSAPLPAAIGLGGAIVLGALVAWVGYSIWMRPGVVRAGVLREPDTLRFKPIFIRENALGWLARSQSFDGSWSSPEEHEAETLATAVLALIASGSGPEGRGPHRPHCDKAIDALVARVAKDQVGSGAARAWTAWATAEVARGNRWAHVRPALEKLIASLEPGPVATCARRAAFHAGVGGIPAEAPPEVEKVASVPLEVVQCHDDELHGGRARIAGDSNDALVTARAALGSQLARDVRALAAFL